MAINQTANISLMTIHNNEHSKRVRCWAKFTLCCTASTLRR